MSAWILPHAHIDAIITTVVQGYKAVTDSDWMTVRDGERVPVHLAGDTVSWERWYGNETTDTGLIKAADATAMGQTLTNANYTSVNARYGESTRARRYTYTGRGRILTLGELAQAIGSLDYQSCEYEAWYTSKARRFLDKVELAIYHRIPREGIPGYTGECHVIDAPIRASRAS